MIGRERHLIETDAACKQLARQVPNMSEQIAHESRGQYSTVPVMWSGTDIMTGLYIAVAVFLLIVLYHMLFIVVDLRKIVRRIESITAELESVIIKPLSVADKGFQWMIDYLEGDKHGHKK